MKKFTLKLDSGEYVAFGETLESVEGWKNGIPEIWLSNKDKITEEDISDLIKEQKDKEDLKSEISALKENKEVLIAERDRLLSLKRSPQNKNGVNNDK